MDEEFKRTNRLKQSDFERLLDYLSKQISDLDSYLANVRLNRFIKNHFTFYSLQIGLLNQYKKNFNTFNINELPNLLYFYEELRIASGIVRVEDTKY